MYSVLYINFIIVPIQPTLKPLQDTHKTTDKNHILYVLYYYALYPRSSIFHYTITAAAVNGAKSDHLKCIWFFFQPW